MGSDPDKKEGSEKQEGSYHHGNLKQALIAAYLEMLQSQPAEKISLRKLAAHIGVAPTAAYNHFKDKIELVIAVKIRCLFHLGDYLENSVSKQSSPHERIRDLGKAYFQYSLQHAQYFNIIFSTEVPDEYVTEELIAGAMRAEAALREAVVDLLKENNLPITLFTEGLGAFACWSLAHGISTLAAIHVNRAACAMGRWPAEFMLDNSETVLSSFDAITSVLVAGILDYARKMQNK